MLNGGFRNLRPYCRQPSHLMSPAGTSQANTASRPRGSASQRGFQLLKRQSVKYVARLKPASTSLVHARGNKIEFPRAVGVRVHGNEDAQVFSHASVLVREV